MKKIILLVLFVQFAFAQELTRDELVASISQSSCACLEGKELTKDSLELTLGLCMFEAINKHEKDVEKHFGKNMVANEEKMETLGKEIGMQLATKCPTFLKVIMENLESEGADEYTDEEEEEIEPSLSGKLTKITTKEFITFSIKEDSGKINDFILLNNFDNSFLITDNILKTNDLIEVFYYELDLYNAKIKNFVTYKIVSDIIKK